jgi:hypothetical protein
MKIKVLHNPVGNHLIYVFYYEFRCRLHLFSNYSHFCGIYLRKKVVITKFVSDTYETQKSLTNGYRRQSK